LAYVNSGSRKTKVDNWLRNKVYFKGFFGLADFARGGHKYIKYYLVSAPPFVAVADSETRNRGAVAHAPAVH
jgi:hypothetical protein